MFNSFDTKKIILILVLTLIFLIIIFLIISRNKLNDNNQDTNIAPTIKSSEILLSSKNLKNVPTLPSEQGGGLDTSSQILRDSATNIAKITDKLPYKNTILTSNGISVEILIPSSNYQENKWTLLVNIFGPDYQVSKDSPQYSNMQIAFREAAANIYSYIKKNGGDPEKIVFKWGDRLFIEERAIEWLQ